MTRTAAQIAKLLRGTITGDPDAVIERAAPIESANTGAISFLANPKYEDYLYRSEAAAILVPQGFEPRQPVAPTLIHVADVYAAVAILLQTFAPDHLPAAGVHPTAVVSEEAVLEADVAIGALAVIESGVVIKKGAVIGAQVYVGHKSIIGEQTILHPGVRVYADCMVGRDCVIHANAVIGSDGFGFAPQADGSYKKIPQLGQVIIKDEVEIGANTVIDRATLPGSATLIHKGAKLDNLIQVAHNVSVGAHTVIAAQAGIAGSTHIGERCMIGGQAGFVGHIQIADGTRVQAQSGVAASVTQENKAIYGYPALDYTNYLRSYAVFKKLPDLYRKINQLERELRALRSPDS
ncbi:MAG: UDP-3-O-(3-hydroxymyristoyl)glucosamine N-acyltransferase [Bacteroidota bacterium]